MADMEWKRDISEMVCIILYNGNRQDGPRAEYFSITAKFDNPTNHQGGETDGDLKK